MEGEAFLEKYSGQSVDEIIQLQESYRIDSLVLAIESALDIRKDSGDDMSATELNILAVEAFEREVNNGGFSQFFYNSSVQYAPIIVNALRQIDCQASADLAQKAIDILAVNSLDPETIEQRMDPDDDALEEALGQLDDTYYNGEEAPAYALFEYIKTHRDRIQLR